MKLSVSFVRTSLYLALIFFAWTVTSALAQQTPSADSKSPSSAPAASPTVPAANSQTAAKPAIPGLDPKTMTPLYEEIQEDWSSLEIGASKLEPQPPMVGEVDEQPSFTRVMTRVQWRPGDPIDLWIFLPKGVKNPPVALYLYSPDNSARFRDNGWAARVTSGGVGAVGFYPALSGPRFHDRPMRQNVFSEFQEALGSTVHDVKFILDYLAKSGQFDMNRVGMFGEGLGGTIAILSAAADSRIKAVDTLDPWGDWPDFLAKSSVLEPDPNRENYTKPEFLKKVAPLDPVKWLPSLKAAIRIQQVRDEDVVPMPCKQVLTDAAPKQAEIMRFATVTDLGKKESGGRLFEWMRGKLQANEPGTVAKISGAEPTTDKHEAK